MASHREDACNAYKQQKAQSRTIKKLLQNNKKKDRLLSRKMSKRLEGATHKGTSVSEHMKRCSALFVTREIWMETPKRRQIPKAKNASIKCWLRCGTAGSITPCWWYKLLHPLWKTVWHQLKLEMCVSYDPVIPLWGIYVTEVFCAHRRYEQGCSW